MILVMRAFCVLPGYAGHYVAYVQRGMLAGGSAGVTAGSTAQAGSTAEDASAHPCSGELKENPGVGATSATQNAHSAHSTRQGGNSCDGGSHDGNGSGIADADAKPQELPWWRVSDTHMKRVTWSAVAACEAYLLLYVRCNGGAIRAP